MCKCRADCITKIGGMNFIVDLKTASDASTDKFSRDAINYGYDLQAGMYSQGIEACTGEEYKFVFIVIEKEAPYAINILQADDAFVKHGKRIFRELMMIYHDCKESGNWYGYLGKENNVNNLSLPAWMAKEEE